MKKTKKTKKLAISLESLESGCLYFTESGQYRAILAIQGEFLIYAPSSEGLPMLDIKSSELPFENSPFKKCQQVTFAQKEYQAFVFDNKLDVRHRLNQSELDQVIQQCNAVAAIKDLVNAN